MELAVASLVSAPGGDGNVLALIVLGGFLLLLYFLPTFVATRRHKRNTLAIFLLNLFAGWTVIGWVVAIVWAASVDHERD